MRLIIFLLLYINSDSKQEVSACLSNQGGCSVANYRYSEACREQYDGNNQVSNYDEGSYAGFLGSNVNAKAYSERRTSSEFAKSDTELHCLSAANCSWQNTLDDNLDWVLGEGRIDISKLALITGSSSLPGEYDQSFFILASNPRPPNHNGQLISMAIGCQRTTGILSFRFWRSRARTIGSEPKLDICTRYFLEEKLDNCLTVTLTDNHTIVASIPPVYEPFVLVLKGYNFENEPEGGLILIDQIEYFSDIESPENCVIREVNRNEIEPFESENEEEEVEEEEESVITEETVISGDTDEVFDQTHTATHEIIQQAAPILSNISSKELIVLDQNTEKECQSLRCLTLSFQNSQCDYKRTGIGSKGEGYHTGWRIISTQNNRFNKLTGIHSSPGRNEDSEFLVANFMGFEKGKVESRFVLEAPEFTVSDGMGAFLGFKKYLATNGLSLSVCEDGFSEKCFWNVYENSSDPLTREWTQEIVLLPRDITTFYIIASQNTSTVMNFGQVGITDINLFSDSNASNQLC